MKYKKTTPNPLRIWKRIPVRTEVHPQGLIEQRLTKLIVSVRPVEGSGVPAGSPKHAKP